MQVYQGWLYARRSRDVVILLPYLAWNRDISPQCYVTASCSQPCLGFSDLSIATWLPTCNNVTVTMRKRRFDAEGSFLRFRVSQAALATNEGDHRPTKSARIENADLTSTAKAACYRCRRIKKKCCRSLPECKTCALAGETCSFPENDPSTATSKEITELRQQVQWLSQCVEGLKPQLQSQPQASLQAPDKPPQQPPNIGQQTPRGSISAFSPGSAPSTDTRTHQTIHTVAAAVYSRRLSGPKIH
jgi:hypothetical protein